MRNKALITLIISFILVMSTWVLAYADGISIKINGNSIESDCEPKIIDGRTMLPVRAIFESLGAEVNWDDATKTIIGKKGSLTVKMKIGEKVMSINGKPLKMDSAATIINERTYAPARYIAESFGFDVSWNPELKEVSINSKVLTTKESTTEITTQAATITEVSTQKNIATTESSTETTTMSAAEILNNSPVQGVGANTYKLIKNDILNAFKVYYIGNFNNNNRFQRNTYNKLMATWDSTAKTTEEKTFVNYSKQVYYNMITTCQKIDQKKAKYPSNSYVTTYCTNRKDGLEKLIRDFLSSKDLDTAKSNCDKIKSFAAGTVAT